MGLGSKKNEEGKTPSIPLTNEQRKGIQQDQMALLKHKQIAGEEDMVEGSKGTEIKETEKGYVHLQLTSKIHNSAKKRYDTSKKIIKMYPNNFQSQDVAGAFQKYDDVTILHDPRTEAQIKGHEAAVDRARKSRTSTSK